MEFWTSETDDVLVYHVKGYLRDDAKAYEFVRNFRENIAADRKRFIVELSGVDLMISSGVGIIATVVTSAKRAEVALRFAAIPQKVEQTLTIVGLTYAMEIYATIEDAREAFSEA